MNYLMVFIDCVSLCLVLWIIADHLFRNREKNQNYLEYQKACHTAIFAVVIFALGSPLVYEFKPWSPESQYLMIRNDAGKIVGLKKDATGFHWPLCSGNRFVCLPDSMELTSLEIRYSNEDSEDSEKGGFVIHYQVSCDNYPKAFVDSNGLFAQGAEFWITGSTWDGFRTWVGDNFKLLLNSSVPLDDRDLKSVVPTSPFDTYNFVCGKALIWNETNPYGCRIQIETFNEAFKKRFK